MSRKIFAFVLVFALVHCITTDETKPFTRKPSTLFYPTISKQIWIPIPSPNKTVDCIRCGERHARCPEPLSRLSKEFLTYPSDTAWCVTYRDKATSNGLTRRPAYYRECHEAGCSTEDGTKETCCCNSHLCNDAYPSQYYLSTVKIIFCSFILLLFNFSFGI